MPYVMTQARAHLRRYMREIKDSLTTPEDVARYEQFNAKLKALADRTDPFYRNNTPMIRNTLDLLRKDYEAALDAAAEVLAEENTGPVGLRIRSVVRELARD